MKGGGQVEGARNQERKGYPLNHGHDVAKDGAGNDWNLDLNGHEQMVNARNSRKRPSTSTISIGLQVPNTKIPYHRTSPILLLSSSECLPANIFFPHPSIFPTSRPQLLQTPVHSILPDGR